MKNKFLDLRIITAIYSIFVGISMFGIWFILFGTDSVPEVETEPYSLFFHVAAELTTALFLIIGAVMLLKRSRHYRPVYYFSMGLLVYTLIASPGYYMEQGDYAFVAVFSVLLILAIILLTANIFQKKRSGK